MIPWTDFELNFLQISDPMCNLSLLLNLNSSICFGSVFFNLTEPKRTEPKLPKHRNFGIFGSVRSSTDVSPWIIIFVFVWWLEFDMINSNSTQIA